MTNYENFFKGKKVTMMGLGLLGRGVGDAEFLAQMGAQVLVTDRKTEAELQESVDRLKKYPNISFFFGGHREADFTNCDMIIKAAGVPLVSPEISAARAANIPVYMSTALFAKFAGDMGATLVGVTGTRGKSTVTHMIYRALQEANGSSNVLKNIGIFLGGNIRGKSTLAMLPEVKKNDICVLELDSWQLQGFGDLQISPHVAVFTTFMPDHLNYYPNMDAYFADKANIFKYQTERDTLVVGETVIERVRAYKPVSRVVLPEPLPIQMELSVPGEHNRANAALAQEALRALQVDENVINKSLAKFKGVEGRLQFLREFHGVKIYNDNNATTPEATLAALHSFPERSIVLIAGGADKGLELDELIAEIQRTCKRVVLLKGTGTDRLQGSIAAPVYDSLEKAFHEAFTSTQKGDVLLFSPAFASFGMFKNEYDRNDQFVALVNRLA